jgi:hypothetical protein
MALRLALPRAGQRAPTDDELIATISRLSLTRPSPLKLKSCCANYARFEGTYRIADDPADQLRTGAIPCTDVVLVAMIPYGEAAVFGREGSTLVDSVYISQVKPYLEVTSCSHGIRPQS